MDNAYNFSPTLNSEPQNLSNLVKVASASKVKPVAGAIAGLMRQDPHVQVQAIGSNAVNQAVKAIAIARTFLIDDLIDLIFTIQMIDIDINGENRTAIRFNLGAKL